MDFIDCFSCNGTGIDDSAWDGRCPFCNGRGEVERKDDDGREDDALDDEGFPEGWT